LDGDCAGTAAKQSIVVDQRGAHGNHPFQLSAFILCTFL
jgi:hypothetical protein